MSTLREHCKGYDDFNRAWEGSPINDITLGAGVKGGPPQICNDGGGERSSKNVTSHHTNTQNLTKVKHKLKNK